MPLVAGLDFGGGAVKACIADVASGAVLSAAGQPTEVLYPAPGRAEFEPDAWWRAAGDAMRQAVAGLDRALDDLIAVTATSLRQGFVQLDEVAELGRGVLNSDRRGEAQLARVREALGADRLYELTGHWSAPQLTLPKLLEQQAVDRPRWERTRTVLYVHDWALWRLSGERVSEPSMASAGQMLDVRARTWADELFEAVGFDARVLPSLHDPGSVVGSLVDDSLELPLGTPVVVGGGDTQMAAAGVGGLADGVVTVVAGTTTPLQASSATVPADPLQHPWVSTHLQPGRWAAETNAGYTGLRFDWLADTTGRSVSELADEAATSEPGARGVTAVVASGTWSEATWSDQAPPALIGFEPQHTRADVARAFLEAHAYAIRGNLEDLERALGAPASQVCLAGGAARSLAFAELVADVVGRPVTQVAGDYPTGRAFAWLAARAAGDEPDAPGAEGRTIEPEDHAAYAEGYGRFVKAGAVVQGGLGGWLA